MKYMKKLAAALLAAVMAMSLLTACSGGGGGGSNNSGKNDALAKALGTKWGIEVEQTDSLNKFMDTALKEAKQAAEKETDSSQKEKVFNDTMTKYYEEFKKGLDKEQKYVGKYDILISSYDISAATVAKQVEEIDKNMEIFGSESKVDMKNYQGALMGVSTEKITVKDKDGNQETFYPVMFVALKK